MIDLTKLSTEKTNNNTNNIDMLDTLDILTLINNEDKTVPLAVAKELANIAAAVDTIYQKLKTGGRLFYLGAGTSGRLGILDAVECPPTYGTEPAMVQGLIAGGTSAIFKAQEGAEDNPVLAETDLKKAEFSSSDVLVGIAASGRTPYVCGGLNYAKKIGAAAIAISCSSESKIASIADIAITPITGAEVITGSTRMKAGTAQKLILNMLSTAVMIKLGKVYGNLMVDVKTTNQKLAERALNIVTQAADCNRKEAQTALTKASGNTKLAILLLLTGCTAAEGTAMLKNNAGHLRQALQEMEPSHE